MESGFIATIATIPDEGFDIGGDIWEILQGERWLSIVRKANRAEFYHALRIIPALDCYVVLGPTTIITDVFSNLPGWTLSELVADESAEAQAIKDAWPYHDGEGNLTLDETVAGYDYPDALDGTILPG